MTGQLDRDMTELPGVREALKIRSKLGVPLDIGGERRGMRMIACARMRSAFFIVAALVAGVCAAQDFPAKPVRIIVGFTPGGGPTSQPVMRQSTPSCRTR